MFCTCKYHHLTLILFDLYWLSVPMCIKFKIIPVCPQSSSPTVSYVVQDLIYHYSIQNAAVIFNTLSESVFAVMLTLIALEHLLFLPPNSGTNYPMISALVIIKYKNVLNILNFIGLTFLKVIFSPCKFY